MTADTSSNTLACSTVDFGRGSLTELLGNIFRRLNSLAGFTFFVLFCFIFLYWLYSHFSFGIREGELRVHGVGEAGCRLSLHLGLSAPPSQGLACPVTYLSSFPGLCWASVHWE